MNQHTHSLMLDFEMLKTLPKQKKPNKLNKAPRTLNTNEPTINTSCDYTYIKILNQDTIYALLLESILAQLNEGQSEKSQLKCST